LRNITSRIISCRSRVFDGRSSDERVSSRKRRRCCRCRPLLAADFTSKVVAITDGDAIRVMHNGAPGRIRLWGIDCPESKQPFGTRAKQFTGNLAFGQTVMVRVRDIYRYKRTVAEIIRPGGWNLNHELVRAGLAWWYQHYARRELGALPQPNGTSNSDHDSDPLLCTHGPPRLPGVIWPLPASESSRFERAFPSIPCRT
jgi:endonuclease YncB( thermonuclease family)